MRKYEPDRFIAAFKKAIGTRPSPACPFCGKRQYTTTDKMASVLIGNDLDGVSIGPTIPSGMLICENCGHIDFFALGVLGLLDGEDEKHD